MAGRVDASIDEFDRAMDLASDDHRLHADISLIAGQAVGWHRSPPAAVAHLTAAAEETDDATPRTALLAHAAMFTSVAGDVGAAHELARAAVDASGGAEPAAAVLAQAASGWTSLLTGEPDAEERFVALASLAGGVAQSGGPDLLTLAQLAGYGLVVIERWQDAGQLLDLVVQRCRTNGWQAAGTFAASALALLRLRQGHWDEAYATALSGLEDARHGDVAGAWAEAFVALITAATGREAETRNRAGAALTAGRRAGAAAVTFLAEAALGHLELSLGNVNAALVHLDRLHADVLASGLREPGVLWYECDYVDALGLAGRRQDLASLVERLDVTSGSGRRMWAEGAAALARAWLATNGDADGWFERATFCHAQLGVPFETARTLFRRGRHRLSRGCRKAGRADLDQAAAAFDRLGARLWARAAGGAREYAAVHRPMDALSPAELRVATVAARGRTNREIATELYVSTKTVDYHLQATYRKLGLRSRTELARLFATSQ
jgi:DNA-binding CsgD family transcriptional regulator